MGAEGEPEAGKLGRLRLDSQPQDKTRQHRLARCRASRMLSGKTAKSAAASRGCREQKAKEMEEEQRHNTGICLIL